MGEPNGYRCGDVEVVFGTTALRRNYEESARAVRQWGPEVARRYINRVNQLYEVRDFREAYEFRSMRLHPLRGARRGELSIYLTGAWRLIVVQGNTAVTVIIREVTNHYDD